MNPTYGCCCGDPAVCCRVWCSCSETIIVSTCKAYTEQTMYACGMGNISPCPIADGTIIGQRYTAWKINNLKLRRVTAALDECSNCCYYVAVTGEEQTGTIEAWDETWYVNCYEYDGDNCRIENKTCEGYLFGPLSGSAGTWALNDFTARLHTECCNQSSCSDQNIRAVLDIRIGGGRTNVTETEDCCTGLTTITGLVVDTRLKYVWDCRHQSRWQDTCPCDLMQEPGQTVIDSVFTTGGCGNLPLSAVCPCSTVGQLDDYTSLCMDIPSQPVITGCVETSSGIICTQPGNNGRIESITGCV